MTRAKTQLESLLQSAFRTATNLGTASEALTSICATPGILCKHEGDFRDMVGDLDTTACLLMAINRRKAWCGQDPKATIITCPFCGEAKP